MRFSEIDPSYCTVRMSFTIAKEVAQPCVPFDRGEIFRCVEPHAVLCTNDQFKQSHSADSNGSSSGLLNHRF